MEPINHWNQPGIPTPIRSMLDLQDQLNQKVHPQWRDQNFPWYRAIWMECGELMDLIGWKWWKASPSAISAETKTQIHLELTDIWHFILSQYLQTKTTEQAEKDLERHMTVTSSEYAQYRSLIYPDVSPDLKAHLLKAVEELADSALGGVGRIAGQFTCVPAFMYLMNLVELTPERLHNWYIGKNALNLLRQDYRYQEGIYQKVWSGEEDNVHLGRMIDEMCRTRYSLPTLKEIYTELERVYVNLTPGFSL